MDLVLRDIFTASCINAILPATLLESGRSEVDSILAIRRKRGACSTATGSWLANNEQGLSCSEAIQFIAGGSAATAFAFAIFCGPMPAPALLFS